MKENYRKPGRDTTPDRRRERISRSPRQVHRGTNPPRSRRGRGAARRGCPTAETPDDTRSRINIDHRVTNTKIEDFTPCVSG